MLKLCLIRKLNFKAQIQLSDISLTGTSQKQATIFYRLKHGPILIHGETKKWEKYMKE